MGCRWTAACLNCATSWFARLQALDLRTLPLDHAEEVVHPLTQLFHLGPKLLDRLFGRVGLRRVFHPWSIGQSPSDLSLYPRERIQPMGVKSKARSGRQSFSIRAEYQPLRVRQGLG